MEIKVENSIRLEDGKYEGTIIEVQYRTDPFEYCDLIIEEEMTQRKLKVGYPFKVMPDSKLGIMLERFDKPLEIGTMIDPDNVFIGKKCSFMTITKAGRDGKQYTNIIPDSVKPLQVTLGDLQ